MRLTPAGRSFLPLFWNDAAGCLYDVVDGDRRDASIRPNQVFAISLTHPVLDEERWRPVLEVVGLDAGYLGHAVVRGLDVIPVANVAETVGFLNGRLSIPPCQVDLDQLVGQLSVADRQLLLKVELPFAVPWIFAGLKTVSSQV